MSSYRGLRAEGAGPLPVPAVSVAVGTRPGRPVSPSGSVGDTMRAARGGAPIVPAVYGGADLSAVAGRQLPLASTKTGPPPISRPAAPTGADVGSTATPPTESTKAPLQSGTPAPPRKTSPPGRGGDHHPLHRSRWEAPS